MIRQTAFALSLLAAGPASALSCAVPTVSQAYANADHSLSDYAIAVGRLQLTGPSDPPGGATVRDGDFNDRAGYTQPARFTGGFFNGAGFTAPQQVDVVVNVTCIASWCGQASGIDHALVFLRADVNGYVLDADACPGSVFHDPTQEQLREVQHCYASGGC